MKNKSLIKKVIANVSLYAALPLALVFAVTDSAFWVNKPVAPKSMIKK